VTDSKQSLRLWLRLLSCTNTIEKKARAMLSARFGTTLPRFDVMAALDREPDGLTMSGLSELLLVSNGNVTAIVARLVDDGLVTRTRDKADRRVLRVKLTTKGRRDFRGFATAHEAWIDRLLADLADGEINQLLGSLGRVKASIERSGL
jgi:DNA-binding MarR family transcriptional regulator